MCFKKRHDIREQAVDQTNIMSTFKYSFAIILLFAYLGIHAQVPIHKNYDEVALKRSFDAFISSLNSKEIKYDYRKAIKNIQSASTENQRIGIATLASTSEPGIIPWLLPLLDSKDNYVRIESMLAISKVVSHHSLKRRDLNRPEKIYLNPLSEDDLNLRPLAWLVLQKLRLPDDFPNERSYAATMSGYLNLYFFEHEINQLTRSRHPAAVHAALFAIEMFDHGHKIFWFAKAQAQKPNGLIFGDTSALFVCDSFQNNMGLVNPDNSHFSKAIKYIGPDSIFIVKSYTNDPHFICEYPKGPLTSGHVYLVKFCFFHKNGVGVFNKNMGFILSNNEKVKFRFRGCVKKES